VPQAAPLQLPLIFQVTAELLAFFTVALNCCLPPVITWAVPGETTTDTAGTIVIAAVSDLVVSAADVAVKVTDAGFGTVVGAV